MRFHHKTVSIQITLTRLKMDRKIAHANYPFIGCYAMPPQEATTTQKYNIPLTLIDDVADACRDKVEIFQNFFSSSLRKEQNKQERLSLATLFNLI
jgi:hypothetical protein